ncbi:MAG TPA: hypothetical protein VFX85_00200 [Solirubrobacterales bacterium]|nr:hypothetical protein [Solirubrobacterales bacterium]
MKRCPAGAAALLAALTLVACGGDSEPTETPAPQASPATLAKANAICEDFLRQTKKLGAGALENPPASILTLTTERLIKPSIPLLEAAARRMQALEPAANSSLFDLYADLYDPAIVLAEKRLEAGRAGDQNESKRLENALDSIGREQRQAARLLGLDNCDVDFQSVLLASLTE